MPTLRFVTPANSEASEADDAPSEVEVECFPNQTVFELGWKLDLGIQSACVGKGTCGLCRIRILSGESALSPYNEVEEKHLGNTYYLTKIRLSCQAQIIADTSDIAVEVVQKKKRRKKN